jgi:hypothetical protein
VQRTFRPRTTEVGPVASDHSVEPVAAWHDYGRLPVTQPHKNGNSIVT